MKVIFLSDIHGSHYYLDKVHKLVNFSNVDCIVLLGDLLYHGPRNPLPKGYDCMAVAELLNQFSDKIIAVRGNCDSEVDQMVLNFDITKDYVIKNINNMNFFITHGHLFSIDDIEKMKDVEVFVHGHYHEPVIEKKENFYIINPNSVSLAKVGKNSFGYMDGGKFCIIDTDGSVVMETDFL